MNVVISHEPPAPPEGWEPVVSTAFVGLVDGRSRGELLAELVAAQRSIVVAGAHGKTTTAAMIAYCLRELGLDPTFLIGGAVPQLGGNAAAGSGWLVAEGDESDRSLELLRPEIGVLTNVDLDHHSTFASRTEVEGLFERWLAGCRSAVRGDDLEPVSFELAVAGEHNRRNAAAALAALELAGVDRDEAAGALAGFRGVGRRLELHGSAGGVTVYDDYAHHPAEIDATLAAIRELHPDARLLALFQPHLYSRTRYLAAELAEALSAADAVCLTDIYAAREQPVAGRDGQGSRRRARAAAARAVDRVGAGGRRSGPDGLARGASRRCRRNDGRRRCRPSSADHPRGVGGVIARRIYPTFLFPPGRYRA